MALSKRQLDGVDALLTSPTLTAAAQQVEVSRQAFYKWLRQPEFRRFVARARKAQWAKTSDRHLRMLTQAMDTMELALKGETAEARYLAATYILEWHLQHGELAYRERLLRESQAR
jgi:hypothetical protein